MTITVAGLAFSKYEGAGNDFVLLDARTGSLQQGVGWGELARALCDRHFGVGADGILVATRPSTPDATERMRMFNPDGSESAMCGNGIRCFGRWLLDRGEIRPGTLAVETGAGVLDLQIDADGSVAAGMGAPRLAPAEIPLAGHALEQLPANGPALGVQIALPVDAAGLGVPAPEATCVSMGNPHAVFFVPSVGAVDLARFGPAIEQHSAFPARANVEVCQVLGRDRMRVRVWERGAGITLACGTGACAAMVAARLHGRVGEHVTVELPGGELQVSWRGADDAGSVQREAEVILRGPAQRVFDGEWRGPVPRLEPEREMIRLF